jgi:hypothetical protein
MFVLTNSSKATRQEQSELLEHRQWKKNRIADHLSNKYNKLIRRSMQNECLILERGAAISLTDPAIAYQLLRQ